MPTASSTFEQGRWSSYARTRLLRAISIMTIYETLCAMWAVLFPYSVYAKRRRRDALNARIEYIETKIIRPTDDAYRMWEAYIDDEDYASARSLSKIMDRRTSANIDLLRTRMQKMRLDQSLRRDTATTTTTMSHFIFRILRHLLIDVGRGVTYFIGALLLHRLFTFVISCLSRESREDHAFIVSGETLP